jgi:hypothetical protein
MSLEFEKLKDNALFSAVFCQDNTNSCNKLGTSSRGTQPLSFTNFRETPVKLLGFCMLC